MAVRPLQDDVLIRRIEAEAKTFGGTSSPMRRSQGGRSRRRRCPG